MTELHLCLGREVAGHAAQLQPTPVGSIISYSNLTRNDWEANTETTRLSSKGQVILPKSVRDGRSWEPGTQFAVEEVPDGVLLRPLRPFRSATFGEVFGCLKYTGRAKTLRQMEKAIAKGVRARHGRGRY